MIDDRKLEMLREMTKLQPLVKDFVAISPSDTSGYVLRFWTREEAEDHAARMNKAIEEYPKKWNTDFWKTKPEPWEVFEAPNDQSILDAAFKKFCEDFPEAIKQ